MIWLLIGVVNDNLIVYGTSNLRVVDASVIPLQIASHIQSTVYAIAEKVSFFSVVYRRILSNVLTYGLSRLLILSNPGIKFNNSQHSLIFVIYISIYFFRISPSHYLLHTDSLYYIFSVILITVLLDKPIALFICIYRSLSTAHRMAEVVPSLTVIVVLILNTILLFWIRYKETSLSVSGDGHKRKSVEPTLNTTYVVNPHSADALVVPERAT